MKVVAIDPVTGAPVRTFVLRSAHPKAPYSVTTGDVNGDGVPDVIFLSNNGHYTTVQIFSGTSDTAIASFFAVSELTNVPGAPVDSNGDGIPDIVVTNRPLVLHGG